MNGPQVFVLENGCAVFSRGLYKWGIPLDQPRPVTRPEFLAAGTSGSEIQKVEVINGLLPTDSLAAWAETELTRWLTTQGATIQLRMVICDVLARGHLSTSSKALQEALHDPDFDVRVSAAAALFRRGKRSHIRRLLSAGLSGKETARVIQAVMNLGPHLAASIPESALRRISESDVGAEHLVAQVRANKGNRRATKDLQDLLAANEGDPLELATAAHYLCESRRSSVRSFLRAFMLDTAKEPWARLVVAESMIRTVSKSDLSALIEEISNHENPFYRHLAARIAMKRRKALATKMRDWHRSEPDPVVRAAMAELTK